VAGEVAGGGQVCTVCSVGEPRPVVGIRRLLHLVSGRMARLDTLDRQEAAARSPENGPLQDALSVKLFTDQALSQETDQTGRFLISDWPCGARLGSSCESAIRHAFMVNGESSNS